MNVLLQMDGVNVFPDLIRGGLKEISTDLMNDDGSLAIGSASVKLSNLNNSYGQIREVKRLIPELDVWVNGSRFFNGKAAVGALKYDATRDILEVDFIHRTKELVEQLKSIGLRDANISSTPLDIFHTTDSSNKNTGRQFYRLTDILEALLKRTSINPLIYQNDIGSYYYMGGAVKAVGRELLPDWTAYDFLKELVIFFDGIWWLDNNDRFYFRTKTDLVHERDMDAEVLLNPIKDRVSNTNKFREITSVEFKYANSEDDRFKNEKDYASAVYRKAGVSRESKSLSSRFRIPHTPDFKYAYIPEDDVVVGDYLILNTYAPSNRAANGSYVVSAMRVSYLHYLMEYLTGLGVEVDLSLIDDESILAKWPFVLTKFRVPGDERYYYTIGASLDPYSERLKLNAINFDNRI